MVRRFVTLTLSFCLVLGFGIVQTSPSSGQDVAKKATPPAAQPEPPKKEAPKAAEPAPKEAPKAAEPTKEAPKATEAPLPPIPPEVQAKIDAARKAVAEAIVAAQDAGLIESSIDPPPILDLLITNRVTDLRTLKNATAKKPYAVSPEVFGAWFTGYGTLEGFDYVHDVRIVNPSAGLKLWYDQRAAILRNAIAEVRKTKPAPAPKPAETKPAETKPAETKKAETPAPAAKPAETKPVEGKEAKSLPPPAATKPAAEPKK